MDHVGHLIGGNVDRVFSIELLGYDGYYGVGTETKACTEVVWCLYHMVGESKVALFELLDTEVEGRLSFIVGPRGNSFDKKPALMLDLIALCLGKGMEEVRALIHDWVTSFENGTRNKAHDKENLSMPFGWIFIASVKQMFSSAVYPKQDPYDPEIRRFLKCLHRLIVKFEVRKELRILADADAVAEAQSLAADAEAQSLADAAADTEA
jgi:hypothetical protein